MPRKGGVEIVEQPVARHINLRAFRLLGGAAVNANNSRRARFLHHLLECEGGAGAAGAEHVVAAAVPDRVSVRARGLHGDGGVPQPGKRIILGQKSDLGSAASLTPFRGEGRGNARRPATGDREARGLEFANMNLRRLDLRQRQFRTMPDLLRDAQNRLAQARDGGRGLLRRRQDGHGRLFRGSGRGAAHRRRRHRGGGREQHAAAVQLQGGIRRFRLAHCTRLQMPCAEAQRWSVSARF